MSHQVAVEVLSNDNAMNIGKFWLQLSSFNRLSPPKDGAAWVAWNRDNSPVCAAIIDPIQCANDQRWIARIVLAPSPLLVACCCPEFCRVYKKGNHPPVGNVGNRRAA